MTKKEFMAYCDNRYVIITFDKDDKRNAFMGGYSLPEVATQALESSKRGTKILVVPYDKANDGKLWQRISKEAEGKGMMARGDYSKIQEIVREILE